jgi:fumarate hydratase subunit alpha
MNRVLNTAILVNIIADLIIDACCILGDQQIRALEDALQKEESSYGRDALEIILKNAMLAKQKKVPCCQDTGICAVFMEVGQEVSWTGAALGEAVNEGVRKGYTEGFLRKSIVGDPLKRINTNDNTPAVLHTEIICGDKVKITVLPKGGGSENMGAFATLLPSAGEDGVRQFVLEKVRAAGGKPCPPVILGIGLGGTMDYCVHLAKKSLLRPAGERHINEYYAGLELKLLDAVNSLGIGPLGMGGKITALDVHIEAYPCHVTALPASLVFQCHAARHKSITI